jgi:hypothetical protein
MPVRLTDCADASVAAKATNTPKVNDIIRMKITPLFELLTGPLIIS